MVSMTGSPQVDSRMSVPKELSCSHTRAASSISRDPAACRARLLRLARCRVPFRRVGLLELRAGDEGLVQEFRVVDDAGHHQPGVAIGFAETVEVLLDRGTGPVRHAVLAQVAGAKLCG